MIQELIRKLTAYGILTGLVPKEDQIYTINRLLELFGLEELEDASQPVDVSMEELPEILEGMLDYAYEAGLMAENGVVYRDLFDTKIMSVLLPRPSEVIRKFEELYRESPRQATDFYYKFSSDSDYIRRYRIKKDMKWIAPTEYGDLDITINLPSRRRIRRPSPRQRPQSSPDIRNACCAGKTRAMRAE